ncbi:MAG TPA: hypothetical protein PLG87_04510 [Treponemataceae bacterium]|jgi:Na+-transporting methylmalonyl-CoA/oxaloacetate decarboxylase gamma subunit|nr:hypothetical protein [Treponemataceae bacterium]
MNIDTLEKSFILMGTGMAVLFLFMGLLIAVVHFGIKLLQKLPQKTQ